MKNSTEASVEKRPAWSVFPELEPVGESAGTIQRARPVKLDLVHDSTRAPAADVHVQATTLSFSNMHKYGDLLASFLRARKRVFIDELHWHLPEDEGMEFDQYDTPQSRWVVIHEFGQILGGLRLTPTTAQCGMYSYMLRDAQKGMLENIPTDVLFFPAPVHQNVWEGTRLFISDAVGTGRRMRIQMLMMRHLLTTAHELGASHLIGFVPSNWYRWIRRIDLHAVAAGPKITIDGTVSQAALLNVLRYTNSSQSKGRA